MAIELMGWRIEANGVEVGFLPQGNEEDVGDQLLEWMGCPDPVPTLRPEYIQRTD